MSEDIQRPYTIVENTASGDDEYYLVYRGKRLSLGHMDYALVTSMLSPDGLDTGDSIFDEVIGDDQVFDEVVSDDSLRHKLARLRKRIKKKFSSELVIPQSSCKRINRIHGSRLLTKAEVKDIQRKIENSEGGVYVVKDECRRSHLFVNGHEVKPHDSEGILELHYFMVQLAAMADGLRLNSTTFQAVCDEMTNRKGRSPEHLKSDLSHVRRALEKVGMTLTRGKADKPIYLVPYVPDSKKHGPRKEKHKGLSVC